jgi:hypothetical protein
VLYWGEVCCELSYGLSGADGVPFWLMRTGNNSALLGRFKRVRWKSGWVHCRDLKLMGCIAGGRFSLYNFATTSYNRLGKSRYWEARLVYSSA